MPNIDLVKKPHLSSFRKMSIGTWRTEFDPQVYGQLKLRVDRALEYMEEFRAKTGKRITMSHLVARAMGAVLEQMPDANALLRFNQIYLRQEISVFFQVALEDPKTKEVDLSGATLRQVNRKSLLQLVDEFSQEVEKSRKGKDAQLEGSRSLFKRLPQFLVGPLLSAIGFLSYALNLDLRWAGIPKDPFGSVMVTNIGSLGLSEAYVPLVPYSRVPLLLALGAITKEPIVKGGQIVPGFVMPICATFDHRILDGAHAAVMAKTLRAWLEDPYTHFDPLPQTTEDAAETRLLSED